MGCGGSKETEAGSNKKIEKAIELEKKNADAAEAEAAKLLLLGAGESGKSTFVKQIRLIHQSGFSTDEKMAQKPLIWDNIVGAMKAILQACEFFAYGISEDLEEAAKAVAEVKSMEEVDPKIGEYIRQLWMDPAVQQCYLRANEFQLIDSAKYFFENVARLADPESVPTHQDILRARVRTTGIVETEFVLDGLHMKLVDVGGQRNERKKWIHCFQGVTAVLFVVAISEYDQKLYEDESVDRINESLHLFEEICNLRWFDSTSIILFLNKMDLFEQKVKKTDLTICFPEYTAGRDLEASKEFLAQKFLAINKIDTRAVYYHFTTATDTSNVRFVFNSARDILASRE